MFEHSGTILGIFMRYFLKKLTVMVMGSSLELRESEMSTCGTLGHALEVAIAHTSYMRGA